MPENKYQTDVKIGIIHIKHKESSSVEVDGSDEEWITIRIYMKDTIAVIRYKEVEK